jgi:hypothetical protein
MHPRCHVNCEPLVTLMCSDGAATHQARGRTESRFPPKFRRQGDFGFVRAQVCPNGAWVHQAHERTETRLAHSMNVVGSDPTAQCCTRRVSAPRPALPTHFSGAVCASASYPLLPLFNRVVHTESALFGSAEASTQNPYTRGIFLPSSRHSLQLHVGKGLRVRRHQKSAALLCSEEVTTYHGSQGHVASTSEREFRREDTNSEHGIATRRVRVTPGVLQASRRALAGEKLQDGNRAVARTTTGIQREN